MLQKSARDGSPSITSPPGLLVSVPFTQWWICWLKATPGVAFFDHLSVKPKKKSFKTPCHTWLNYGRPSFYLNNILDPIHGGPIVYANGREEVLHKLPPPTETTHSYVGW